MRNRTRELAKVLDVELVQIGIPVIIEAVAVTLIIACGLVWLIIFATPAVPQ